MKVTNNIGLELKAIQVDDYWVIVDLKAEININDFIYDKSRYSIKKCIKIIKQNIFENDHLITTKNSGNPRDTYVKIIASTKFIDKSIPVIKFVEQNLEEYVLEHFTKKLNFNNYWKNLLNESTEILDLIKAKFSEKKYTQEDIINAYDEGCNNGCSYESMRQNEDDDAYEYAEANRNGFIEFLNEPILPETIHLEFEDSFKENNETYIHSSGAEGKYSTHSKKLKTTTSPEGQKEIVIKI